MTMENPGGMTALDRLASPEAATDPFPIYTELRQTGPVQVETPLPVLFLSRYEDCAAAIRDPALGVQTPEWSERTTPGWRERPASWAFQAMLFRDPPNHTRLRRAVARFFTPRRAEQARQEVRSITRRALDQLAERGADGALVDMQEILAETLPVSVIGSVIGIPEKDWPTLRAHMRRVLSIAEFSYGPDAENEADEAAITLRAYFTGLAAARRAAPRDDLASDLVAACDLADGELVQMLAFLFMGGTDTMTNLLAAGCAALLSHPAQAQLLRGRPELARAAVEEMLRYDAPVHVIPRVAAQPTAVCGVPVRPDQLVVSLVGAANRDPRRYADPDTFDITRNGSPALSFGGGIHHCLGAPLARVEAGEFFAELTRRFPGLRAAGEPVRDGLVFRRFSRLPVIVG